MFEQPRFLSAGLLPLNEESMRMAPFRYVFFQEPEAVMVQLLTFTFELPKICMQ